jgi:H+/Cl- antiporter ClcA
VTHNRLLLACGGAAGVAAGFNAPIAGIFFALEVIQGSFVSVNTTPNMSNSSIHNRKKNDTDDNDDNNQVNNNNNNNIESENLISTKGGISSIVLSSVLAALFSKTILGDDLVFKVARYSLKTPLLELPLYLMLGSMCGVLAFIFTQFAACCKGFFDGEFGPKIVRLCMLKVPKILKPVIGGLFCGLVGIYYPQVLFFGYETLNNLLTKTSIQTHLLLTLLVVKMTVTSVAAGSGLVGGLFAPSLFFGGMLGASFRNVIGYWLESIGHGIAEIPAYAMIGSASVLAALFRAPLTGSLILFECTREYDVILPLMASAGLASVVAELLETWMKRESSTAVSISTPPSGASSGSTIMLSTNGSNGSIDRKSLENEDPEMVTMIDGFDSLSTEDDRLLIALPSLSPGTRQNSNGLQHNPDDVRK